MVSWSRCLAPTDLAVERRMGKLSMVSSTNRASYSDVWLFCLASSIWGTTWFAIKFQLGTVVPEVSVVWRFALASLLLFGWCRFRGIASQFSLRDHGRLALLGVLLFGLNYVLVYRSEQYLPSGLVSVLFAFLVFWNLLGARICFGTPAPRAVLLGAILGVAGVCLLFWPEIANLHTRGDQGIGILLAVAATAIASAGNLYSQYLFSRGIAVVPATAVAMAYAALGLFSYCIVMQVPLAFEFTVGYVLSLVYLASMGSVVAFVAFLTLLRRIGAGRAGYTAAVIPLIAMIASTVFEGYRWSAAAILGLLLVLAGTIFVLRAKDQASRPNAGRSAAR